MDKTDNNLKLGWLFWAVMIAGIVARLLMAMCGHNYDTVSCWIVSQIVERGGNVYAETSRYNYGPVWFHVLHALNRLAGHDQDVFRYLLAGFLSLVDAGIFYILWRKYGRVAACLFFFNPISVIITGYQSQFDNLAVLLGLLAAWLVGDEFDRPLNRRKLLGLFVLGLSLTTKHLFFAFPFWLAVKQKGIWHKAGIILLPVGLFLLSFVPYWSGGRAGIIHNVFMYQSLNNEFFYNLFVPLSLQQMYSSRDIWYLLLIVFAFVWRRKNTFESLLLYTAVLVTASPAVANQYLAIPVPFVATHINIFTLLYTAFGTLHLLVDGNGLYITGITGICADIAISMLCLGLIWLIGRQVLMDLLKWCISEVKNQFGGGN
jgi:uncharacterized protein Usg